MAIISSQSAVTASTAVLIGSLNADRYSISIQNIGSNTVFIAGSNLNLTSGTGFPVLAGDTLIDEIYSGNYYAIGNGSSVICVLEQEIA
jgi:hypothetical protein